MNLRNVAGMRVVRTYGPGDAQLGGDFFFPTRTLHPEIQELLRERGEDSVVTLADGYGDERHIKYMGLDCMLHNGNLLSVEPGAVVHEYSGIRTSPVRFVVLMRYGEVAYALFTEEVLPDHLNNSDVSMLYSFPGFVNDEFDSDGLVEELNRHLPERKIQAIKALRKRFDIGLRNSKRVIDDIVNEMSRLPF